MNDMRGYFQIDPDVTFLNHGSFGATPLPVFAVYQAWQRRLERQPVYFFGSFYDDEMRKAREAVAAYVNGNADDLVFVHNATFGVNVVARSLKLQPGDEILTTEHEYGACTNAWDLACRSTGARYVRQPLAWPVQSSAAIVEQFWQGVTPRTKVIYLSHITSPTALTLPVAVICARARDAGILTVIDGAHAPGQIDLDLAAVGADVYTGNLHKWLCAPKGCGFLWVNPAIQPLIEPLVASWGYGPERLIHLENDFVSALQWQGTDDPAAYLSAPAAIAFQQEHAWPAVRARCHDLLRDTLARIVELTGMPPAYPTDERFYHQMGVAQLPPQPDLKELKQRLWARYRIEVPLSQWKDRHHIRISVQGYNTEKDLDRLLDALDRELILA